MRWTAFADRIRNELLQQKGDLDRVAVAIGCSRATVYGFISQSGKPETTRFPIVYGLCKFLKIDWTEYDDSCVHSP